MNSQSNLLSRRQILVGGLTVSTLASLAVATTLAAADRTPSDSAEYIPENDYPYFDYQPESCEPLGLGNHP